MRGEKSIYEKEYEKMGHIPDEHEIGVMVGTWATVGNYIRFYETWIRRCARLDPRKSNPNVKLLKRWEG